MINGDYFMMCLKAAINYIPQNLMMSLITLAISVFLGTFIAMARTYEVRGFKQLFDVVLALLKALPPNLILLIVFIIYNSNFTKIMQVLHLNISIKDVNLMYVAIVALTICCLPGISEVIRSGLMAVDHGQYEAGYAIGLTKLQTFFHIIAPQAIRAVIPPITNSILSLVKATALVNIIGVVDIMNGAKIAGNTYYCYMEAYLAAALVFWVIGLMLEVFSHKVEGIFSQSVKKLA